MANKGSKLLAILTSKSKEPSTIIKMHKQQMEAKRNVSLSLMAARGMTKHKSVKSILGR